MQASKPVSELFSETVSEPDRAAMRRSLLSHPVHRVPPVGDPYVFGRWHPDRASVKGLILEALALGLGTLHRASPARAVVLCRPRSGSSLLVNLLGQVPAVRSAGEPVYYRVLAPAFYLQRLAAATRKQAFICKVLSYQLFEVQKISDQMAFFEALEAAGFRLVHLRRRTFWQSLSLSTAQATGQYFVRGGREGPAEIALDPDLFLRQVRWNRELLAFEDTLMAQFPHERVVFESDLARPEAHQATVDRLCDGLGVATAPVEARTRRTGGGAGRFRVANLEALKARLRDAGLGAVVDEAEAP